MYYLAPIALALLLSGALYTTKEVWNLDLYKLQNLAWEDTKQFQKAVNQGKIPAEAVRIQSEVGGRGVPSRCARLRRQVGGLHKEIESECGYREGCCEFQLK